MKRALLLIHISRRQAQLLRGRKKRQKQGTDDVIFIRRNVEHKIKFMDVAPQKFHFK